jgi:arsenate reductase
MKILFLCVANSARSQLAEGLAKDIFPEAEIQSAGSYPGKLNSLAVQVMEETGLDISRNYSKSIDDLSPKFIVGIDYIITLCAEEACPVMVAPKAKKLRWVFPDPVSKEPLPDNISLSKFREVRDGIRAKLLEFKKSLSNTGGPGFRD